MTATYYVFHPFETSKYKVVLSSDIKEYWRLGIVVYDENSVNMFSTVADNMLNIGEVSADKTILIIP